MPFILLPALAAIASSLQTDPVSLDSSPFKGDSAGFSRLSAISGANALYSVDQDDAPPLPPAPVLVGTDVPEVAFTEVTTSTAAVAHGYSTLDWIGWGIFGGACVGIVYEACQHGPDRSAVPEPGALAALVIGVVGLSRRRRV